jgi:hypothetical protein
MDVSERIEQLEIGIFSVVELLTDIRSGYRVSDILGRPLTDVEMDGITSQLSRVWRQHAKELKMLRSTNARNNSRKKT